MTTNNIQELLDLASETFTQIDGAIENQDWEKVFQLLDTPQPEQWIKRGKSDFFADKEYEYNEIELLEAILNRVFYKWSVFISNSTPIQDKGKFAVTTKVALAVYYTEDSGYRSFDGIATTYAESIKHLTLATPKSVTDAVKNACKRMGRLLGGGLNRGIEDLQIIQTETTAEVDHELEEAKATILSLGSWDAAAAWLKQSPWKYNQDLRTLINTTYFNKE